MSLLILLKDYFRRIQHNTLPYLSKFSMCRSLEDYITALDGDGTPADEYRRWEIFGYACEKNEKDVAKFLWDHINIPLDVFNRDYADITFQRICRHGHLNILQWLLNITTLRVTDISDRAFRIACEHNRITIIDFVLDNIVDITDNILNSLCKYGHFAHIKQAREKHFDKEHIDSTITNMLFRDYCVSDIFDWCKLYQFAKDCGIVELLDDLVSRLYIIEKSDHNLIKDIYSIISTDQNFTIKILDRYPQILSSINCADACLRASESGYIELSLYLFKKCPECQPTIEELKSFVKNLEHSTLPQYYTFRGCTTTVNFIVLFSELSINDQLEMIRYACERNHQNVVIFLHQCNPSANLCANNNMLFIQTCMYGHLNMFNLLLVLTKKNVSEIATKEFDKAFYNACMFRQFDIINLFLQHSTIITRDRLALLIEFSHFDCINKLDVTKLDKEITPEIIEDMILYHHFQDLVSVDGYKMATRIWINAYTLAINHKYEQVILHLLNNLPDIPECNALEIYNLVSTDENKIIHLIEKCSKILLMIDYAYIYNMAIEHNYKTLRVYLVEQCVQFL